MCFFLIIMCILYIFGRDIVRLCDLSYHLCWCCELFVVNISIPKSLYIYCFIFYIDIYYDYMYLLLGHVVFLCTTILVMEIFPLSIGSQIQLKIMMSLMKYQIINKHFLSISAISISVYSVCLCMYNYYVHVHTHKIDSTSPVNQKLGTLFFFIV